MVLPLLGGLHILVVPLVVWLFEPWQCSSGCLVVWLQSGSIGYFNQSLLPLRFFALLALLYSLKGVVLVVCLLLVCTMTGLSS